MSARDTVLIVVLGGVLGLGGCYTGLQITRVDIGGWTSPNTVVSPGAQPGTQSAQANGQSSGREQEPKKGEAEPPQKGPKEQEQHPIDLESVFRLAGANAVEIELAKARANEAINLARAEEAQFFGELVPTVSFFRHEGREQATVGVFFDVDKQNAYAGGAIQLILQPGEVIYRSLAARRRADAAENVVTATTNVTLQRAAGTYFALVSAYARIKIAEDAHKAARELLAVETSRQEEGVGLPASVARARARVAETERDLEEARTRASVRSAALVRLLTLDPSLELVPRLEDAAAPLQFADADRSLEDLLVRAYENRPEIAAAKADLEAAAAERGLTGHGWLIPDVRLGASFGGFGPDFGGLEDRQDYFAALQWSFDFGMTSRHRVSEYRESQAKLRVEGLRHQVASAVVIARREILAARARMESGKREVEAAEQALQLIRSRKEEGADLLLKELDAQSALTRASTAYVVAVSDHNAAQYALLQAIGGPR